MSRTVEPFQVESDRQREKVRWLELTARIYGGRLDAMEEAKRSMAFDSAFPPVELKVTPAFGWVEVRESDGFIRAFHRDQCAMVPSPAPEEIAAGCVLRRGRITVHKEGT